MLAIFLDTETTGLDPFFHRILEIAFKIVDPATGEEKFSYQAVVKQPWEVWEKRDLDSIEFNGFTWEKVNSGKEERFIREEIIQILTDFKIARGSAVFICQNPAFDRKDRTWPSSLCRRTVRGSRPSAVGRCGRRCRCCRGRGIPPGRCYCPPCPCGSPTR